METIPKKTSIQDVIMIVVGILVVSLFVFFFGRAKSRTGGGSGGGGGTQTLEQVSPPAPAPPPPPSMKAVAVNPATQDMYVYTDEGENYIIKGSDSSRIQLSESTISSNYDVSGMAITRGGSRLFFSSSTKKHIKYILFSPRNELMFFEGIEAGCPTGIVIDSTSTYMYVSDYDNNSVYRLNIITSSSSNKTTIASNLSKPMGIAISSNDSYLYVSLETSVVKISIIDNTVTTIVSDISPRPLGIAVDPFDTIYITDGTSNIKRFFSDGTNGSNIIVPHGNNVEGLVLGIDGNLYASKSYSYDSLGTIQMTSNCESGEQVLPYNGFYNATCTISTILSRFSLVPSILSIKALDDGTLFVSEKARIVKYKNGKTIGNVAGLLGADGDVSNAKRGMGARFGRDPVNMVFVSKTQNINYDRLFVADGSKVKIVRLDDLSVNVDTRFTFSNRITGIALSSDDRYLSVTDGINYKTVDRTTNTLQSGTFTSSNPNIIYIATNLYGIPSTYSSVCISSNQSKAYVLDANKDIYIYYPNNNTTIPLFNLPKATCLATNNTNLFVGIDSPPANSPKEIYEIVTNGFLFEDSNLIEMYPKNFRELYVLTRTEIYLYDTITRQKTTITSLNFTPETFIVVSSTTIYIAGDDRDNRIYKWDGTNIQVLSGQSYTYDPDAGSDQSVDGVSTSAKYSNPYRLWLSSDGMYLYVSEMTKTRKVNTNDGSVTTILSRPVNFFDSSNNTFFTFESSNGTGTLRKFSANDGTEQMFNQPITLSQLPSNPSTYITFDEITNLLYVFVNSTLYSINNFESVSPTITLIKTFNVLQTRPKIHSGFLYNSQDKSRLEI